MEFSGVIEKILPPQKFTKNDGTELWKFQFVIRSNGQNYQNRICMTVFGEEKWKAMNFVIGGNYNVSYDVNSREYNNKWYTECVCWKVTSLSGQQPQNHADNQGKPNTYQQKTPTAPAPQAQPQTSADNNGDDLPF